ncbi:MAG TPA: NnrS family protein [Bradyrhizobium sp.]|uniref:NnrS family protein n=1 Tax=Bradyrhizobium sp. TaxID=376 RepID=UPI002C6BD5F8|nr:NnrS family protein [Bradyrhizobium sp.]HLZ01122.1 NnrS family protein [Bradyrhizobium sp.]
MAISRLRAYQGPALLSYGFRPFFLLGSIYSGAMIPVWLCVFQGELALRTAFVPRDWHVHEMLFGYVAAVIGGFLLTAVPNWTGRLPLQGAPLAVLVSSWLAGRIAVCMSAWIGWAFACAIDAAFLALLAAAAAREIIVGRQWGNVPVVAIVSLFAAGNIAFHIEAHLGGLAEYSTRFAIALVITLVALIGGRIVPSFTRNWLARQRPGHLPAPVGRFDAVVMVVSMIALVGWIIAPATAASGIALIIAGCLHLVRLARWAGYRTMPDRLVLILHLAYAFVPVGYLLAGLAAFDALPPSAGIHAWTGGAIGSMTIAVMTRATLGHTGRALRASVGTQCLYAAVIVAALMRISASLAPEHMQVLLATAGTSWTLAFLGFAVIYGRALCMQRVV